MSLKELNDNELERKLLHLTHQERQLTTTILEHLKEIDERKLFAKRGYPSLFSYCTDCVGYSEGAASRRISSMRLLKECPEVRPKITNGELSLSNLARAATFFRQEKKLSISYTPKEKAKVLDSLSGKTQKQAEETLVNLNPRAAQISEAQRLISPELTQLKLTLDKETTEKLERLKQLKPEMSLNDLFSWMLLRSLKQIDPARKPRQKVKNDLKNKVKNSVPLAPTQESLPQRKFTQQKKSEKQRSPNSIPDSIPDSIPNSIPNPLFKPLRKPLTRVQKYQVWQKAGGCCQFMDSLSNRICESKHGLEIDHIQPLILGGTDDLSNLRLLCREHHRLQTQNSFK